MVTTMINYHNKPVQKAILVNSNKSNLPKCYNCNNNKHVICLGVYYSGHEFRCKKCKVQWVQEI